MLNKFKIGHKSDVVNKTGVTVIMSEGGATAGVYVKGHNVSTREIEFLKSKTSLKKVDAVVLSGGGPFGLEACAGVNEFMFEQGYGKHNGHFRIPLVSGASIYDLDNGDFAYPDKSMGYLAAQCAKKDNFQIGQIGAGTGAAVGKITGVEHSDQGGVGIACAKNGKAEIAVLLIVNTIGDVVKNGEIIAGAKNKKGKYINTCDYMTSHYDLDIPPQAAMVGCIMTNVELKKGQANLLAEMVFDGIASAVRPARTKFDGNVVITMASGEEKVDFTQICTIVPSLAEHAVYSVFDKEQELKTEDISEDDE